MYYNAVPVAASPTLIGDRLVVLDNQGTAVILAPGREFKLLGRNRIETRLERVWPLPAQETLAYAPQQSPTTTACTCAASVSCIASARSSTAVDSTVAHLIVVRKSIAVVFD